MSDKVEPFMELVGMTKSPLIKGKNIEVFVKGIMPGLLDAAAKAGKAGVGAGAGAKRPAPSQGGGGGRGGGGGKKAKTAGGKKGAGAGKAGGGASSKVSAASGGDEVSSLGDISSDDEDGGGGGGGRGAPSSSKSVTGGGGGGGFKMGMALVEDPQSILADSDGKLRGELHLVERCPALIYKSWRVRACVVHVGVFERAGM